MYVLHVSPRKSTKWVLPDDQEHGTTGAMNSELGARDMKKTTSGSDLDEKLEDVPATSRENDIERAI